MKSVFGLKWYAGQKRDVEAVDVKWQLIYKEFSFPDESGKQKAHAGKRDVSLAGNLEWFRLY